MNWNPRANTGPGTTIKQSRLGRNYLIIIMIIIILVTVSILTLTMLTITIRIQDIMAVISMVAMIIITKETQLSGERQDRGQTQ